MKEHSRINQECRALTLIELLLVVFVVFILIAILLPMANPRHPPVKKLHARIEMADLTAAIKAYESEYGHLPLAFSSTNEDVTCGISSTDIQDFKKVDEARLISTNSDLVIVLMDFDLGVNAGHKLNPKAIKFLNARVVEVTNLSGVSLIDYQYRDPWGNPYIITVDSTGDNQCCDFLYCAQKVSQWESNNQKGFFGLINPVETNGGGNHFYFQGKVMVWSAGPDKKFDPQTPANAGVNKDNVLSWQ